MSRKVAHSRSSAPNIQSALVAAAIQDHLLRSLLPSEALQSKSRPPTLSKSKKTVSGSGYGQVLKAPCKNFAPREVVITETTPSLTLAEKLGVFQVLKSNLSEDEWKDVKVQALARGAFSDVCPICQESLGARQEILLSCSHTFHRQCIASLERFAGQRVCPVCRQHSYEARIVFEATNIHKNRCIVKIQAWWRGCIARREYKRLRKLIPPKDPRLRKRFFEDKLSEVTDRLIQNDAPDVESFLVDLDRSVERARRVYQQFEEKLQNSTTKPKFENPSDWEEIVEMALNREDDTCPICLASLGVCSPTDPANLSNFQEKKRFENKKNLRPVILLSCTHLFHVKCLDSFEHYAKEAADLLRETSNNCCPLCRTANYEKICIQSLFSA